MRSRLYAKAAKLCVFDFALRIRRSRNHALSFLVFLASLSSLLSFSPSPTFSLYIYFHEDCKYKGLFCFFLLDSLRCHCFTSPVSLQQRPPPFPPQSFGKQMTRRINTVCKKIDLSYPCLRVPCSFVKTNICHHYF